MNEYGNGRFNFRVVYRDLGDARGLAIHVFGPTGSGTEEILRFDCFDKEPHYHLAWSYRNDPFIRIESDDPFKWSIEKLRSSIKELLEERI